MFKRRHIFRWAILILSFGSAAAAQYRFDSWTTDNGLPQNSVASILQTRDGYLWFTTFDGLVRFDGVRFTVFNKSNSKGLTTNRFTKIFADNTDALWICAEDGGLIRMRDGEFQTFTVADGLPSNIISDVQQDRDGSILAFADTGAARWRGGRFVIEKMTDLRKSKEYIAPSGIVWRLNGARLQSEQNGSVTDYVVPFDKDRVTSDETKNFFAYAQMFEDRTGALWIASNGLHRLKDNVFKTYGTPDGLPKSLIKAIEQDANGDIWIGTVSDGACRLDQDHFRCFGTAQGLSSSDIVDLFADREGTLWLTTNDRGVNRLTGQIVQPFAVADGLPAQNVYPILQTATGTIWIGTVDGLAQFQNGKVTNFLKSDGLLYEIVSSLHQDRAGNLWIGSVGGVEVFDNEKFTDFTKTLGFEIGEADFYAIQQDSAGAMWFATNKGLVRWENERATRYTTADGLPSDDVKTIYQMRDESLRFGTYGGLAQFENQQFENRRFVALTEKDGLAGNHVRAIYEDQAGVVWFGTYDSGLSRLENGAITNYTTADGLFSNGVFAIVEDERGNFWMSSNQGIYRVAKQQLNDFAAGKTRTITSTVFGKSDGMLSTEANGGRQPAALKAEDGRLWFPTQNGAAIIDPNKVPFNPLPPPVVIEAVKIDNVLSAPTETTDELPGFTMQPNQNNLEINYTGLSFIKPEQIRFRYRLEGLDETWTEAGARRAAYFPYLPPGAYAFHVVAANSDGVWNEDGARIAIVVLPPFYRTFWFAGLLIVIFGAGIFGIYRRRVAVLERGRRAQEDFSRRLINAHEAERRRIAAELHDSIGQTLAMIKNRAVFAAQTTENLTTAHEQFDSITSQTTQAISEVREISYNLRPYLLERLGLTKAIKSLLNKIEEVHLLKVAARIDDVDGLFSSEAEMSVYRIIQESLNNVAKHADTNGARLTIENANRKVTIIIEDDGRGFDKNAAPKTDAKSGGFGLLGISERVRMLNGTLDIQTAVNKGTKLTIRISGK